MNEHVEKQNQQQAELARQLSIASGLKFTTELKQGEDHASIILMGQVPIYVTYYAYQKTFYFGLRHHLPYMSSNEDRGIIADLPPQKMHKINGKRIIDWVNYYTQVWSTMQQMSISRQTVVTEYLRQCRVAGITVKEVLDWNGNKTGAFNIRGVRNGISYESEISSNNGYISKKLSIHYNVKSSIESFLMLSDNKYQNKE